MEKQTLKAAEELKEGNFAHRRKEHVPKEI